MSIHDSSVFKDPQMVREQLDLPTVIKYSFVGVTSPEYHARLEEIVVRVAREENIRNRTYKVSSQGTYTSYRFEIYHDDFQDVEELYREIMALEGTKFVV
jgi:putative lipoic acid-binding regulatory protein